MSPKVGLDSVSLVDAESKVLLREPYLRRLGVAVLGVSSTICYEARAHHVRVVAVFDGSQVVESSLCEIRRESRVHCAGA